MELNKGALEHVDWDVKGKTDTAISRVPTVGSKAGVLVCARANPGPCTLTIK